MEIGETHTDALERELEEELGIKAVAGEQLAQVTFKWKENVDLYLFAVMYWAGEPTPIASTELRWVDPEDAIDNLPMLPSAFMVYQEVISYLKGLP